MSRITGLFILSTVRFYNMGGGGAFKILINMLFTIQKIIRTVALKKT